MKQSDPPRRIILNVSKDPSTWLATMLCIGLLRFVRNDSFGATDLLKELKGYNTKNQGY